MVSGRPRVPRLTQITSLSQVSREALRSRMERATEPILVQVRDKELPREERRAFAAWVRDVARSLGHLVVINGDLALALELQLDGAHLPERRVQELAAARATLGPQRLLTAACHDLAGAAEVAALGADALLLSPIFASPGKGALSGSRRSRAPATRSRVRAGGPSSSRWEGSTRRTPARAWRPGRTASPSSAPTSRG